MPVAERFEQRELTFPADLSRLHEVRRFADTAAAELGFDAPERYQIAMAANEAVANAVEHGSPGRGDTVAVRAARERGTLSFYVEDRGTFAAPEREPDVMDDRGRGLMVIDLLMDELEVRPGEDGTIVRFAKRLSSPAREPVL